MPLLLQIACLVLASAVALFILSGAWSLAHLVREAPEALDRVLYRAAPAAGTLEDPIATAGLE